MARTVADLEVTADADTSKAESKLKGLGRSVNSTAGDTKVASAAFIGMGAAIAGGLALAIGTAANFEAGISAIGAASGLSGDELDAVRTKALQLGADTSFSATEAASAIETLVKAGMPIETVLKDGAQAALDLAAATGTDVTTAAGLMTTAMNVFGTAAGSATDVADLFTAASNASATSVEQLALGFSQAALPADMMGLSANDLAVALALFSQNGLQGSDAGTSFKTMLLALLSPTKEQKELMDELGLSFFDAQGNFIGLDATAQQLQDKLGGLTEEQRNAAMATIFGSDAVRAATILYNGGADGVDAMRTSMENQSSAADQAKVRMDNLKGAIETLRGTVETAMIMVGSQFTPAIQGLANQLQGAVSWFTKLDPSMQGNIAKGAALAAGLLVLAGGLGMAAVAIGPVVAGLGLIFSPIGLVIAAIAGLYLAYTTNFLGFADGVNAAIDGISGYFADLQGNFDTLKNAFITAWPTIKAAFDAALPGIQTALDGIAQSFKGMAEVVGGIVKLFISVITLDFDGMKESLTMIVDGVKDMFEGQFTAIAGLLGGIVAATKVLVVNIWNGIKDDVTAKATGLKDDVVEAFTGLKDDALDAVDTLATDAVAKMDQLAIDIFNSAWTAGTQLGAGIKAGVEAMKDAVMGAVGDLVDGALDKLDDIPGFSPIAHVGEFYGGKLGMGFASGISGSIPSTMSATSSLADSGVTTLGNAVQSAPVSAGPGGPSVIVHQTNHYTISIDELEDVANAAEFVRSLSTERELAFGGAFG